MCIDMADSGLGKLENRLPFSGNAGTGKCSRFLKQNV